MSMGAWGESCNNFYDTGELKESHITEESPDEEGWYSGVWKSFLKNGELKSEGGSITEGIGSSRITKNFENAKIDDAYSIDDHEALPILFDLIQNEGLSLGTSCGINIAGAIRLGKELGPGKTIVTILCDKSDKYATKMFNKKFLQEKNLSFPNWL